MVWTLNDPPNWYQIGLSGEAIVLGLLLFWNLKIKRSPICISTGGHTSLSSITAIKCLKPSAVMAQSERCLGRPGKLHGTVQGLAANNLGPHNGGYD